MKPSHASVLSLVLLSTACSARGGGGGLISDAAFPGDTTATGDATRTDAPPPIDRGVPDDRPTPVDVPAVDVPPVICTPGSAVCLDAQTARVCSEDGRTATLVPCGGVGGRCEGGRCSVRLCVPGAVECADGSRRRCSDDGSTYTSLPCPLVANGVARCDGAGTCLATCNAGYLDCNGAPSDGCEASLNDSSSNCGSCGRVCPANTRCSDGTCVSSCMQTLCSGACVDITSNATHCGACDLTCSPGQACVGAVCTGGGGDTPRSCQEIHTTRPTVPSGVFRIDPDGAGSAAAFEVFCDMTTAGGGWTLAAIITNNGPQNWSPRSASWVTATTFGVPTSPLTNADAKSAAFNTLAADEVMIGRMSATFTIEVQTTSGCLQNRTLLAVMSQSSVYSTTCALSCAVVTQVAPFPGSSTSCHAAGLRFRCRDDTTTVSSNGFSISTDDNSFITSMSNSTSCTANQSGFGASTGSTYADLDTDIASSIVASDITQRLLFVR